MTQIIGDYGKRKRRFNPDLARIVNERTEREIRQRKLEEARRKKLGLDSEPEDEIKEEKKVIIPNKDFKLEELADSWIVSPVSYNDGLYAVEFGNSLLDNGDTKTQDNWVKYSLEAKSKDKLYVGDFPLYYSIFSTLFKNKDNSQFNDLVEKAKTQINHFMQQHWLMTLTRIKYVSNGKDKVIHNYGMPEQYEINENIVGEDEWVKDSNTPKIYQSLIGSDNIQEINSVLNGLIMLMLIYGELIVSQVKILKESLGSMLTLIGLSLTATGFLRLLALGSGYEFVPKAHEKIYKYWIIFFLCPLIILSTQKLLFLVPQKSLIFEGILSSLRI